uniref:(northern house mosquito) hypothetical protein n=1 Tax=Culex pipiens TaxID=7175 RepID=A0A8D8F3V8_CULPI
MLLSQPRKGSHTHSHTLFRGSSPIFVGGNLIISRKHALVLGWFHTKYTMFSELFGRGLALRKLDKYKRRRIFARFRANDPDYGCVVTFEIGFSLVSVCVCIKRAYHKMVNFPSFSSDECQYCSLDKYVFLLLFKYVFGILYHCS